MRRLALLALLSCAAAARAADKPSLLLCSVGDVFDCSGSECTEVQADAVGLPDLIRIDATKKTIAALDPEFKGAANRLESVTSESGRTVVRSRSGDRILVLAIDKQSGDAVMTVSDVKLTLVAFGECARP